MSPPIPPAIPRRALLGLGAGAAVLALSARPARADALADIKSRGELVGATVMQFPPFDFIKDGQFAGIDRELIDFVASELGVKSRYLDLPFTSILPGLDAGKFDLCIAPLTVTIERMKHYAFTVPIADATAALMRRADNKTITKPSDISGKIVGGQKGSAQLAQLREFAATLPVMPTFREYTDNNQAYADLAAGRTEATTNSLPNLASAAAQRPDTFAVVGPPYGKPSYFSWAGRLGDADASLMSAVNAALLKMERDGRMAEIQKRYFGAAITLPTTLPAPLV